MANTGTFRSAINGFNRQDVMDYLESASQRYETLKKERNELDRMRAEQLNRVKELEGVQEEAAAIKEQAAQEVAEALEQLRVKEEECESLRASLESVTAERIFFALTLGSSNSHRTPASDSADFDILAVGFCRS